MKFRVTGELGVGYWNWTEQVQEREQKLCVVCDLEISERERIYNCPHCSAEGHYEHFQEWLVLHNSCPNCRRPVMEPQA